MVAVGTRIAPRPPHRSRRALLTHRAPPSGRTSVARGLKPHALRRAAINRIDVVTRLSVRQWQLGENATISITDQNGILIALHPDPHGVGQPIPDSLKPFLSAPDIGAVEATGVEGVVRLCGYVPVAEGPSDRLAVFVGRDRESIFADINRSIWMNAAVVLTGLPLSAGFAVFYIRRFLARPFQNLLAVAGRWRDDDWSAHERAQFILRRMGKPLPPFRIFFRDTGAAIESI
jgi:hypothetical protein